MTQSTEAHMVLLTKAEIMLAQIDKADDALKLANMAEAARVWARKVGAGTTLVNHATQIKARALKRMAEVVTAGQKSGEIGKAGGDRQSIIGSSYNALSLQDLGIKAWTLQEARKLAALSEDDICKAVAEADAGGKEISYSQLAALAKSANSELKHAATKAAVEAVQKEAPAKRQDQLRTVKLGDVWQLGRHLLYCGDTSKPPFEKLLKPAALCFADPPYGVGTDGYDDSKFYWQHDHLMDACDVMVVTPGIENIFRFARLTNMPYRWALSVWFTNGMTRGAIGFGNWAYAAVFSHGSIHRGAQDFTKITIDISTTKETDHPTRKPTQFIVWVVELFSKPGQLVLDPFLGSGTTLLACEQLDRTCIGGELDPLYCADIIRRWEGMTDKKAVRA